MSFMGGTDTNLRPQAVRGHELSSSRNGGKLAAGLTSAQSLLSSRGAQGPAVEEHSTLTDSCLRPVQSSQQFPVVVLCWLMLSALGCSYGISVRRIGTTDLASDWRDSAVEADALSSRSRETLHRLDLERVYAHSPARAFVLLEEMTARQPQPECLFALAEMSYVLGRTSEKEENPEVCAFYYLCAGYAYHYLFDDAGPNAGTVNAFDPRFRLACDLYNMGLAKCIRAAQRSGRLDTRQQLQLSTADGKGFLLSVVHRGFPWPDQDFGPLLFCSDYEVVGLASHYHGYGLGTALIGTRLPAALDKPASTDRVAAMRYPREISFPVSAFFRFEGTVADLRARRAGCLELYNPLVFQTVEVGSRVVPLENDLTTPLAYF